MPSSRDDRRDEKRFRCGAVETRARSPLDSVRAGIGSALRSLHSDVLYEPLPDWIVELLRQLDEQLRQLDQDADKA